MNKLAQLSPQEIQALFAQQVAQNSLLTEKLNQLQLQLDFFKRQLFGQKSEKRRLDNPEQSELFPLEQQKPLVEPEKKTVDGYQRRSSTQRSGNEVHEHGLRFDDSVPQKMIDLPPPALADGDEIIGYKETYRLAQRQSSYEVLVYRRPIIKHQETQSFTTTSAPSNVLDGCYCDVSLLAGLMVDKALYHLPLHRQHQRMLASGIQVSRSTLTNWLQKAIYLLKPIYQAQREHILQGQVLAMDETPMKAGLAGSGKMKQSYFWPMYGEQDEIAFTWSATRRASHAFEQLKEFQGVLLTDGYVAYEKAVKQLNQEAEQITHASCWAHARRYFERASKVEPKESHQALDWIGRLYHHEAQMKAKSLDAEKTLRWRREKSEPIVYQFFQWVYQQRQRPELLPKNPLRIALEYAAERERQLKVFLSAPEVPVDTNHLERSLRCIALGRKNHLFCWTELGAEHLGILQSLVVTCRLHSVDPYQYLVDVLQRIANHPNRELLDLTPRLWKDKFKENFLTSDLS